MSHDEISCTDALEQLWALIDCELDDANTARVREHIERCRSCYPQYDFDRAYRELLRMQCTEKAPPELRRRLFMRLLEES